MKRLVALTSATLLMLSGVALAADQKLTLGVDGAVWPGCAGKLATALGEGGLKVEGKINPNQGKGPVRVTATADEKADLGAAAKKVNDADTPHKDKTAPGLNLVLFARLDKDSADKAEKALAKVKGVDAKGSKVDREKGEISVKLSGDKVTVADITNALKDAGIEAKTSKAWVCCVCSDYPLQKPRG